MATETETETAPAALPDVAQLRAYLDGEYAELRDRVRGYLEEPEYAPILEMPREEYREHIFNLMKRVAESSATGMGFPREYGGEADPGGNVAAFETLAFGDLSLLVKFGVQFGLFGGAVHHLGTERHHEKYIADIASAKLPGCFAMTETGHGSNVQALGTTATYEPEAQEFVINTPGEEDRKDYIGNSAVHGQMAAVFAQLVVDGTSHGVHALLVPIRDQKGRPLKGVTITDDGPKVGLNGVDNGRISFDHVRVPRENLLNRYADVSPEGVYTSPIENIDRRFFTMIGTLIQGRVCVAGAAVSAAKSALTIAVRHGLKRRQFGPPDSDEEMTILSYPIHQRRLMPLLAENYALHFAQRELLKEFHTAFSVEEYPDENRRELETITAALKAASTWHATKAIQTCREACGGAGYLAANRFAALKADTDVFTTFEGDNTVLTQLVAKSLLTGYRDHFGELNPIGLVSFVAGQFFETVAERSAARELIGRIADDLLPGREDEEENMLHRAYQVDLFRWRQEHVLSSLARRLKNGIDAGADPFEVFLFCQDHVITLGRVHTERLILESFASAVENGPDELHTALNRLCDLYAMSKMEEDRAWLQEHGKLSSTRAKAVIRNVNRLCSELVLDAGALVDAFGVPEQWLAAEIG